MKWAAIDFETATRSRTSACALGVVIVDEGCEVARQAWLIRPPDNRYEPGNVAIHGIHPSSTQHAPDFRQVWDEALYMIGDRPLVAHNAGFDIGVVRRCCEESGMQLTSHDYFCTVQLARRTFPDLGAWKLPIVAAHIGTELNHHDALSDAIACSRIAHACLSQHVDATTLRELSALHGLKQRSLCDAPRPRRTRSSSEAGVIGGRRDI